MPSEQFTNPFESAAGLIRIYRQVAHEALLAGGMSEENVLAVIAEVEFAAGASEDPTQPELWLTLRRPFVKTSVPWWDVAKQLGLHDALQATLLNRFHDRTRRFPYVHQQEAILSILDRQHTVIATGTGSGKTESFLLPILEYCIRNAAKVGVKAIIVYPRNALAKDQVSRIREWLKHLNMELESWSVPLISVAPFTGETEKGERAATRRNPPSILVTNHVMLERILTLKENSSLRGVGTLAFIVLDEVHMHRGNAGADVSWLIRRLRENAGSAPICIGASATLKSEGGSYDEADANALHDFLYKLFGTDAISYVGPRYSRNVEAINTLETPVWNKLGWSSELKQTQAIAEALFNLPEGALPLLNDPFNFSDDDPTFIPGKRLRDLLAGHPVIAAWEARLSEGALCLSEIVDITTQTCNRLLRSECSRHDAGQLTQALMACIAAINFIAFDTETPEISFFNLVTHIVMRKIGSKLRFCLVCNHYDLSDREICRHCGCPTFASLRDDPKWVAARLDFNTRLIGATDGDVKGVLVHIARADRLSSIPENAARVHFENGESHTLRFVGAPKDGSLVVAKPVTEGDGDAAEALAVDRGSTLNYLSLLVSGLLSIPDIDPRVLLFGDAREAISLAGYELREQFADWFLMPLALDGARGPVALCQAYAKVRDRLECFRGFYFDELRRMFPVWFTRLCCTSPRLFPEHRGVLLPSDRLPKHLTGAQKCLVKACLDDGCVFGKDSIPPAETRNLFEFYYRERTTARALTFAVGGDDPTGITTVRLTDRAVVYKKSILEFGVDSLMQAASELLSLDVLIESGMVENCTGDGTCFALNAEMVALNPLYLSRSPNYIAAEAHTSETPREMRERIEEEFPRSDSPLRVLLATSTLEVGVDMELKHVICYGVPPDPASYAQRSGRAGRSKTAWYATCTTWCDDESKRDSFFFSRREELRNMISGTVRPPVIEPDNPLIVRRHLFACLIQDRLSDRSALNELMINEQKCIDELPTQLIQAFTSRLKVGKELTQLQSQFLGRQNNGRAEETWFGSTLCPDYGFRDDEIKLVVADSSAKNDVSISQRAPEQAVGAWSCGSVVALPHGFCRLLRGISPERHEPSGLCTYEFQEFKAFLIKREEGEQGRGHRNKCRVETFFDPTESPRFWKEGWLTVAHCPRATISIVNCGTTETSSSLVPEKWGIRRSCDAIVLGFDETLIARNSVSLASFTAALLHGIQDQFKVDSSDLYLMSLSPEQSKPFGVGKHAIALADIAQRGLVPLAWLAEHLDKVLEHQLEQLEACSCSLAGLDGCSRCLRTTWSPINDSEASRSEALNILKAYLRRSASWAPLLPLSPIRSSSADSVRLTLRSHAGQYEWAVPGQKGSVVGTHKSAGIEATLKALAEVPSGTAIAVDTNVSWMRDLVLGRTTAEKQSQPEEARLLMETLRFSAIEEYQKNGKSAAVNTHE